MLRSHQFAVVWCLCSDLGDRSLLFLRLAKFMSPGSRVGSASKRSKSHVQSRRGLLHTLKET